MMKFILLLLMFAYLPVVTSQALSEKDQKKHIEKVTKSRLKAKNILSLDTLFASGNPYCIMKGVTKSILGYSEYSVRPLKKGTEVIYLSMVGEGTAGNMTYFWDLSFLEHGKKIRFSQGTDLENLLVDYQLLNDSSLNIAGMNKLLLVKGEPPVNVDIVASVVKAVTSNVVNRNRDAAVMISGNKIMQGGTHIGNIEERSVAEAGNVFSKLTISLPTGELVATAKNGGVASYDWTIITAKDNKTNLVNSSIGKDKQDVVQLLVNLLYL